MRRRVALGAIAVLVASCTTSDDGPITGSPATSSSTARSSSGDRDPDVRPVDVIDGLDNVSTMVAALGSVWAVTTNRPDEFSPGDIRSAIQRIEPVSREVTPVMTIDGVEPDLVEAGDRLWVAAERELVALDRDGADVARLTLPNPPGGVAAAGGLLWVADTAGGVVLGIDARTAQIVSTTRTGAFPVGPISAFGRVFVPDLIDGTLTIIDAEADAEPRSVVEFVTDDPKFVLPMIGREEVWVTNIDGDVFAASSRVDRARSRRLDVGRPINSAVMHEQTAFLLPTWGTSVLGFDASTGTVVAEIPIDSIPVGAIVAHDLVWVTGDGLRETLTAIDPVSLTVIAQFEIGTNESTTTGPRHPIVVGDEIWVPNRGDDAIFIVDAAEL